ncbi:MAG: hypothetical protein R2706_02985 [Acidimicrobiales bacterium]
MALSCRPVGGERLASVGVDHLGLAFDRGWALFRAGTNDGLTARRTPELLFASASVVDGDVVVTLPSGQQVNDDDSLSAWLGFDVELRRASDSGGTYEVPLDFETDSNWVSWTGPGGAFHDSARARVSIVSTSTLGDWDVRRFRTNIVVDGSGEDAFVGSSISVGESTMDVIKQIDRCVMITRPQPGLEKNLDLLKFINRERATFLSIGANPTGPATIALGDEVQA